jgi:hypothetical protein
MPARPQNSHQTIPDQKKARGFDQPAADMFTCHSIAFALLIALIKWRSKFPEMISVPDHIKNGKRRISTQIVRQAIVSFIRAAPNSF